MPETITASDSKTATTKKPTEAVYLYQPGGAEDRSVGVRTFLYTDANGLVRKASIQRGAWLIPYAVWKGVQSSVMGQRLLEDRQLLLIAKSANIFEDFSEPLGINGAIRLEDVIDKCFDKRDDGLLRRWASYLQTQDLTKQAKLALYLQRVNARLEAASSPLDLPGYSDAPLDPSYNNYSKGLGQI